MTLCLWINRFSADLREERDRGCSWEPHCRESREGERAHKGTASVLPSGPHHILEKPRCSVERKARECEATLQHAWGPWSVPSRMSAQDPGVPRLPADLDTLTSDTGFLSSLHLPFFKHLQVGERFPRSTSFPGKNVAIGFQQSHSP